jgi:hypothetical protein
MPSRRFDWHEHILEVANEYRAARLAVDRLNIDAAKDAKVFGTRKKDREKAGKNLRNADRNLEGTYLIRLFAAFESALRSYDRSRHNDSTRETKAAVLIDEIAGKRNRGISTDVRDGAHKVPEFRNYWAHEGEEPPEPMTIDEARGRLQKFLAELPDEW